VQATETRSRHTLVVAAIVGVASGLLSGLFGVGGGILIVPGLVLWLKMKQRLAHGTSLGAILPIAVAGVIGFALDHSVDWTAGGLVILGAIGGAVFGARLLGRMSERWLRLAFGLFLVATAIRLLLNTHAPAGRGPLDVWLALALVAIGIASGIVAGLLGVGGGIIVVPALVVLFSVPDAIAKGTSLLVIIPTAISGTIVNRRVGNIDTRVAAIVGLTGAGAAFAGSKLATHIGAHLSSVLFASLLLLVSVRFLLPDARRAPST
jgi:uncharacterized membrane protein YfcA